MNNLFLIISVAFLGFILFRRFALSFNKNVKNLTAKDAYDLIKSNKEVVVLDVRSRNEFKTGHIPGAKCIPVTEIASKIGEIEKYKERPIIVHCASGSRSPAAVRTLLKNDFKQVHHMSRGLFGWKYGLK